MQFRCPTNERDAGQFRVTGVLGELEEAGSALSDAAVSEVIIGLHENELPVRIFRIDRCNYTLAPGMAVIKSRAEGFCKLVVGADVPDVSQATEAVARATRIAERLRLKCTSA